MIGQRATSARLTRQWGQLCGQSWRICSACSSPTSLQGHCAADCHLLSLRTHGLVVGVSQQYSGRMLPSYSPDPSEHATSSSHVLMLCCTVLHATQRNAT